MKINRMSATFGKLDNETMEFEDGLNIIVRPNESGKSTWCAFIRSMLYGVSTSDRAKNGYIPDRQKYAPWSGKPMQGTMNLTKEGKEILLARGPDIHNAPMRDFHAYYADTSIPVEGLNGTNAGEKLVGVPREVFTRSAFVGQGNISVNNTAELEKRILSIVSTGEEDVSYTEADARLRMWQRERRFSAKGKLPQLESSISDYNQKLRSMQDDLTEADSLQQKLDQVQNKIGELEQELDQSRETCRKEAETELKNAEESLKKKTNDYVNLSGKAKADQATLRLNVLDGSDPDEVAYIAEEDTERAAYLHELQEDRGNIILPIVAAVLTVIFLLIGLQFTKYAYIGTGIFAVLTIIALIAFLRKRQEADEAYDERMEILAKYQVHDEEDIYLAVDEFLSLYVTANAAEEETKEAYEAMEKAREDRENLEKILLSGENSTDEGENSLQLNHSLSTARQDRDRIATELALVRGRLMSYGDPLVMKTEIEHMEEERIRLQQDYDAIAIAVDALRDADAEVQSQFTPKLGACAAEYLSFMTDGKYDGLYINKDFSVQTGNSEESVMRRSEFLSAGTVDLLYLAVRLAVCKIAMQEEDPCPLILDDPFVNFDAERERQAMKLLEKLAEDRQIILFSCREINL